jgi:hypothetical protein
MANCVLGLGGSAKGDFDSFDGSMGEYTAVASANRGVRGGLNEDSLDNIDDSEPVLVLRSIISADGRFFSSSIMFMSARAKKGLA